MRALKAYADATALGQQTLNQMAKPEARRPVARQSKSGDCISFSQEALGLVDNKGSVSVMPRDATYDKNGTVLRQFDDLQADLRALSGEFINQPGSAAILSGLGAMQSHARLLRAQV